MPFSTWFFLIVPPVVLIILELIWFTRKDIVHKIEKDDE